jgi:hypothetical protein
MNGWRYARFGAILLVAIGALFAPLAPGATPPIGWTALLVIFGACCLSMPIILGLQRVNPRTDKLWRRPSWRGNPLLLRNPVQFFYFAACLSITQAAVILIRIALTSTAFYVEALVPLAMGVGILAGIKLVLLLFASKFEAEQS